MTGGEAIHPAAARGFSVAAEAYERGRPDYPSAAIEHLTRHLGLRPGRRALDLGAGTGKLTRLLERTGASMSQRRLPPSATHCSPTWSTLP